MAAVDELRADLKATHSTAQHCSTQHLAVAGLQHRLNEWVMMVTLHLQRLSKSFLEG
jgi:hypothetical protein